MTAQRRSGTDSTAALSVSSGILIHSLTNDLLRDSILAWNLAHAFASKIDQIQKSIGFRSGLEGGHSSFEIKPEILF